MWIQSAYSLWRKARWLLSKAAAKCSPKAGLRSAILRKVSSKPLATPKPFTKRSLGSGVGSNHNVIGRSLENKDTLGEGTVEAVVKLNS